MGLSPTRRDSADSKLDFTNMTAVETKTEVWLIQWSDNTATAEMTRDYFDTVQQNPPILSMNYAGSYMYCIGKNAVRVTDSGTIFELTVTYQSPPQFTGLPQGAKMNFQLDVDGVEVVQDAYQDAFGNPIVNSAGRFFDPTLQATFYDEKISIIFDSSTVDTSNIDACRGLVNGAACTLSVAALNWSRTFQPRQLKLRNARYTSSIQGPLTVASGTPPVFRISYDLLYRKRVDPNGNASGFTEFVLDRGYEYYDKSGNLTVDKDQYGNRTGTQVLLNGSGQILPAAGPTVSGSSGADWFTTTQAIAVPPLANGQSASQSSNGQKFCVFKMEAEADFSGLFTGIS